MRSVLVIGVYCTAQLLVPFPLDARAGDKPLVPQCCAAQGVELLPGGQGLRLARAWQPVFDDRFDQGLGRWKVHNYRNALRIDAARDELPGGTGHAACITRDDRDTDTAFELCTSPIPVTAGRRYRLEIQARHDIDLAQTARGGKLYWTKIDWQNASREAVAATPFRFDNARETWYDITTDAAAPAGVVSAVVRIGFDSPNIHSGHYLRIARVKLTAKSEPPQYVAEGQLLSRPQRLAGRASAPSLASEATLPAATTIKFQVRSAPDVDGGPRDWTPFCGPDGSSHSFFTPGSAQTPVPLAALHRGHAWFQYRASLSTTDDRATPVLRRVRLGEASRAIEDSAWDAPDREAPRLADYQPRRTADPRGPLVFRLADNSGGVGLDRHSVEAFLDGQPVTSNLKRQSDGTFRCDLPSPLKPFCGLAPLDGWSIGNYQGRLLVRGGPPRVPGAADSLVIRGRGLRQDTAINLASPPIAVQGGAKYQVAFWSRHTMDLRRAGGRGDSTSGIRWLDSKGMPIGPPAPLNLGPFDPTWHEHRLTVTAPEAAAQARLIFGWDTPDLVDNEEVAFADPRFDGPHPDRADLPNVHRVTIRARDLAGNGLARDWWILVKSPPAAGIVTVRDDGVTLIDGKPFFPIGMYSVWKREHNANDFERCFAELAAAGFNTAHTYQNARGPELREFYEAARRHHFKVIIAPQGGANNPNVRNAIGDVVNECLEPTLLSWYLADDTASHIGPDRLRAVHEAIRDLDPFHLTVQADGVFAGPESPSRYADYVHSTDAFLPELYPIRSSKRHEVAEIIRDMKLINADLARAGRRAPVWAIIQDFEGWGWERFPTNPEVRAMTWLAIIHGATGMTWYTYGGHGTNRGATHDPQVWANLKQLAGQLARLHDVLVQRDPPQTQRVDIVDKKVDGLGYPAISTRLKRHQGKHYLMAANSADAPVEARFAISGLDSSVDVLFENRRAAIRDGGWTERFVPHEVHVYCW